MQGRSQGEGALVAWTPSSRRPCPPALQEVIIAAIIINLAVFHWNRHFFVRIFLDRAIKLNYHWHFCRSYNICILNLIKYI